MTKIVTIERITDAMQLSVYENEVAIVVSMVSKSLENRFKIRPKKGLDKNPKFYRNHTCWCCVVPSHSSTSNPVKESHKENLGGTVCTKDENGTSEYLSDNSHQANNGIGCDVEHWMFISRRECWRHDRFTREKCCGWKHWLLRTIRLKK